MGREKQLAMTIYDGWDDIEPVFVRGTNPDSEKSVIIRASAKRTKMYGYDRFILISQVITKESCEDFSEDEVFPIRDIIYSDKQKKGGYGDIVLILKDGSRRVISYDGFEEYLTL